MTEFRGARGSNTGDDFHELWATRQAIRLLLNEDDLQALAVEGLAAADESGASEDVWDGVDCTLYFGGVEAATASKIVLEQLKYSGASPSTMWTTARLIGGKRRDQSVIARLAKAWKKLIEKRPAHSVTEVLLVSNQSIDSGLISAIERSSKKRLLIPKVKPRATADDEKKLMYATGLDSEEFQSFAASVRFEGGAGSRFALEEKVLSTISDWIDQDLQQVAALLRQFVRQRMRPEFSGELITRDSIMMHLGVSDSLAIFPCLSEVARTVAPVSRGPVREAVRRLLSGEKYICLHGRGGVGKTTSFQEIGDLLPAGSLLIQFDCYGGGRYLDPSAFRHRSVDAFLQLTNELASRLRLPLLLTRHQGADYPRLFMSRLRYAAEALAVADSTALIVIGIDAADNSITAANTRIPLEQSFVTDFVRLMDLPENVRFVITARTGRLSELGLPSYYQTIEIEPFSLAETEENVRRVWEAPKAWVEDFHALSGGVPRVQAYALQIEGSDYTVAIERLRPSGKTLDDVFLQQFDIALRKSGSSTELDMLCAGMIALPRPVPLSDLAGLLSCTESSLVDTCADLAPGIRLQSGYASFADEDFEHFVRMRAVSLLYDVQQRAATWLLSRATFDQYAALNVATALAAAERGSELLDLVEREPVPIAIVDPVLRREAELQRLRLAIKFCREAGDIARAIRFVLIGAEGINTESVLIDLLVNNPDMAASFAQETVGRLILSDPEFIESHGAFLFQKLSVDASRNDALSVREGRRLLKAWLQARKINAKSDRQGGFREVWKVGIEDISSSIAATLKIEGAIAAINELGKWTPKKIALDIAISLPTQIITQGHAAKVVEIYKENLIRPAGHVFLQVPLLLAGHSVDMVMLEASLAELVRHKIGVGRFFSGRVNSASTHASVLDMVLMACEILTVRGAASQLVDSTLEMFLSPEFRRIDRLYDHDTAKLDLLFRAYALSEARAGRCPDKKAFFTKRPEPIDELAKKRSSRYEHQHDSTLGDLTAAIFDVYAAIADALVHQKTDDELYENFDQALGVLRGESWRISRVHGGIALREYAGKSLLVLLAAGYNSSLLMKFSVEIHEKWLFGGVLPDEDIIARLSLRSELHESLLVKLAEAADKTSLMRIGAEEKTKLLVGYARILNVISKEDANVIFNNAIESAGELDREVVYQIRFLDTMIERGEHCFSDRHCSAQKLSDVVVDAAIRLEGFDYFPWKESMSGMARLDTSLALANAARWDDDSVISLEYSLPPLLTTALECGVVRPTQALALTSLLNDENYLISEALAKAVSGGDAPIVFEEMAYDSLIRCNHDKNTNIAHSIEKYGLKSQWVNALQDQTRFLTFLRGDLVSQKSKLIQSETEESDFSSTWSHIWQKDSLIDSKKLQLLIDLIKEEGREKDSHLSSLDILRSARSAVCLSDRLLHLSALAGLTDTHYVAQCLLEALAAWSASPAVKNWCKTKLPEVIVSRLPEMTLYMQIERDLLSAAIELTELSDLDVQKLILRGIEQNVDSFESERIFLIAGVVARRLPKDQAAHIADWYLDRLISRVPVDERDQILQDPSSPKKIDEAVARFLFAYMGDVDLRVRWRSAHAVRCLARTQDLETLKALNLEYGRQEENSFRSRGLSFYWLASKLWFVIVWERIAREFPSVGSLAGATLLKIAIDDEFPHLLIRSFAHDACMTLIDAGVLVVGEEESTKLGLVNRSSIPRVKNESGRRRFVPEENEGRRFKFDPLDTIQYWYRPLLASFATLSGESLLNEIERCIVDSWGYGDQELKLDEGRWKNNNKYRDWSVRSNSHGAIPTIERLSTHLEWHGMWCAAGELLKTEPLTAIDDEDYDTWDDLYTKIRHSKLTEPPLWSADLRVSTPLISYCWEPDLSDVNEWVISVEETDHRAELFPSDRSNYIVIDSSLERRMKDRYETRRVCSALVGPSTAGALIRALQTMNDSWDYKLPSENENFEVSVGEYQLLGWISESYRDSGIDDNDLRRGHASAIKARPGSLVSKACGLTRDSNSAKWISESHPVPMFIYEAWGVDEKDDERFRSDLVVCGHRLLVDKKQLQEFLIAQGMDLVVEVEVSRRGREDREYTGEKENKPAEGRYDRLYRLQCGGVLEVAEKCIGAWTADCQ